DECWPGFFFFAREYYGEFFSCFESPARLFFVDSISRSFFLAVPAICVNGGRVRFLHFSLPVCFPDYRPRAFLGRREHCRCGSRRFSLLFPPGGCWVNNCRLYLSGCIDNVPCRVVCGVYSTINVADDDIKI